MTTMIPFFLHPVLAATTATPTAAGTGSSFGPLIPFLLVLGSAALVSFVAEYIAHRFGSSLMINGRMAIVIVTTVVIRVFWIVWSQQSNFADRYIDPMDSSFRMFLWLFFLISVLIPLYMSYHAVLSVWYDRWMPGVSLFAIRVLVCIVMVAGYAWTVRAVLALLPPGMIPRLT